MSDKKFLQWIHARLNILHRENPQYDYMLKLQKIIDELPEVQTKLKIKTTLAQVLIDTHGNQTQTAKKLQCNRGSMHGHISANGIIVLNDNRIFRDTRKIYSA